MRVHPAILMSQQAAFMNLTEEALDYIVTQVDPNAGPDGMRHVMRHLYAPDYERRSDAGQAAIRAALKYMIHCADAQLLDDIAYSNPDNPVPPPDDLRQLFRLWWEALFGDEPWGDPDDLCDAEVVDLEESPGGLRQNIGPAEAEIYKRPLGREISPDIVLFPRTDGLPPGHGAPPPDRVLRVLALRLPRRPTDGARFFRHQDQAKALRVAKRIHALSGQYRVWVEFDWPVGEGYLAGGDEYRRTNWACVRFSGGKPVDSFPDLRKGWPEKDPEGLTA